jgi:hypothetical protein
VGRKKEEIGREDFWILPVVAETRGVVTLVRIGFSVTLGYPTRTE